MPIGKKGWPLRNAHNDTGREWTDDDAYKHFRAKWTNCLKMESRDWDGKKAMGELKSSGAFNFLDDSKTWQQSELLGRIFAEIHSYKREVEKLLGASLFQQEIKDVKGFLRQLQQRTEKKRTKMHYAELKRYLAATNQELERAIERLPKTVTLWKRRNTRSPLTIYEQYFPQQKRMWLIARKDALDTRLQMQMAKMFAFYLSEYACTRQTFARLIVMTYMAADLARIDPKTKTLKAFNSDRDLTVHSVADKIAHLPNPVDLNTKKQPDRRKTPIVVSKPPKPQK